MAIINIDLSGANGTEAKFVETDLSVIKIGEKTLKDLGCVLDGSGKIVLKGYGTLAKTDAAKVTFTATADLPAGSYAFIDGAIAKFSETIDLSAATGAITVTGSEKTAEIIAGSGNTKISGGKQTDTFTGAAGNDTLDATAATVDSAMTGGKGADVFINNGANSATIKDYNYAEGDVFSTGNAAGTVTLSDAGALNVSGTTAGNMVSTITATGDVFKVKVENTDATKKGTTDYWTAANGKAVVMDASAVKNAVVVNAATAKSATIMTGAGNDTITAANGSAVWAGAGNNAITLKAAGTRDTIWIGKSEGKTTVSTFDVGFEAGNDVINLYDATIADVSFDNTSKADLKIGSAVLDLGLIKNNEVRVLVQEKGEAAKKVAFLNNAASFTAVVSDKTDVDVYVGDGSANSVIDYKGYKKDSLVVNLQDTAKYRNIAGVVASTLSGGTYIGAADKSTTITVGNAASANTAYAVWGGGAAADTISLDAAGTANSAVTVWYGNGDGADTLSGFKAGFGAANDTIKVWNSDLGGVSLSADGSKLKVGVTELTHGIALTANAVALKLEDKDSVVKNVAFSAVKGANSTLVGDGADYVIGMKKDTGFTDTVKYTKAAIVNLQDASKFYDVEDVDMAGVTAAGTNVVIGGTGNSTIQLATVTGSKSEVWGGGAGNDAISLGAAADDVIWFGTGDGNDTITGFAAQDKIKFWDKSVAEIAASYKIDSTGKKLTNGADSLDFGAPVADMNILDKDNKEAKVAVATAGTANYKADTQVYIGKGLDTLSLGTTAENTVIYLGNGTDCIVGDKYYGGISTVDATNSTGSNTLMGDGRQGNTLFAGKGGAAIWGGGAGSDVMIGNTGVDQFWFGAGDGLDKIAGVGDEDRVILYNATSISDITATVNSTDLVISTAKGDTLTIEGAVAKTGLTFQVGTDANSTSYTYDAAKKEFVAK